MGGHGAYLLDFDTNPSSPGPALPLPPVVLTTARSTSDDHPCYAQTRRVSRDDVVIHIFQTPSNAFYVQPGLIDSNFDFLILEAQR
jgi:hypothetical protein